MPSRIIKLELPYLRHIHAPTMMTLDGRTISSMILELSRSPHTSDGPVLRDVAKLFEVFRLAMLADDLEVFDREIMTEGEMALVRGQQTISEQLGTIITLMKKEAEAEAMQLDRSVG